MFGNRIKQIRQEYGWSQGRFAKQCGVNQSTIHRIESGAENPKLDTVSKIAAGLGLSLDELMGGGKVYGCACQSDDCGKGAVDDDETVE